MAIATINPFTGRTEHEFEPHSEAEVDRRIAAAQAAFTQLRSTTFAQRSEWMRAAAQLLEDDVEQLARLITIEMGRPIKGARAEVLKCAKVPRWKTLPLPPAMPKPADTGFVENAGAKIYYARFGKGDPVILLHGGMGNGDHWSNQVPALAEKLSVITIDSRGHGRSTRSKDKPSYDQMATDVIAVMDKLKLEKAAIVGWSDGGEIALKLGINYPTRITKLVVFGANYDANGSKKRGPSLTFSSYSAKCRADYTKLSKTPKQYDEVQTWLLPIWRNPMGFTKDQLKAIKAPTLVADGEYDEIIKLEQIEEMSKLIPNAQLHVFKEASHFALWQDPKGFTKVVLDFLTQPAS